MPIRTVLLAAVLLVPATLFAQSLDKGELKPGADITLDLPRMGMSSRSRGAMPVQMRVILPRNFAPEQKHPVLVFLGGGYGDIKGAKQCHDVVEGNNFICLAVDYDAMTGYDSGFKIAQEALRVLESAVKIDTSSIVAAGESSGAYAIVRHAGSREAERYCAFIPIIGGMEMKPASLGRRPILNIVGELDKDRASGGRPRVDVQIASHEGLKKAKCDTTLIVQTGVGHAWKADTYPAIRTWLYEKVPALAEVYRHEQQLEKAKTDVTRLRLYQKIAESWLILPSTEAARAAVAARK